LTEAAWSSEAFTAGDGYRWRYRLYPAAGAARADVVCLHGIQSHAGWYEHSCTRLAAAGFEVSFLDRRGSGVNEQARGDAPSFRRLLDDLAEFLRDRRGRNGGRRIVVLAVSWGGKLAAALPRRHPGLFDALALLCPGFCPRVGPTWRQRLAILGARLVAPARRFPIPLSDPELFTATPRWLEFLRRDPLALHQATARFLVESVRLDAYLRRVRRQVAMPTLLMLAGRDRILDNTRTRAFVERFAGPKEVIEYPEAHHTLEFEPDPDRFLGDLLGWLGRRLDGRASPGERGALAP
jgi:alpha-beta hydrolase superfamily lysophospholipase